MSLEKSLTDLVLDHIDTASPGLNAVASDELTAGQRYPALVVGVNGGKEVAQGSGVYRVRVAVEVLTELDEPDARANHSTRVATVRERLEDVDALMATLNAGGIRCYAVHDFAIESETRERYAMGGASFDAVVSGDGNAIAGSDEIGVTFHLETAPEFSFEAIFGSFENGQQLDAISAQFLPPAPVPSIDAIVLVGSIRYRVTGIVEVEPITTLLIERE